MAERTMLDEDVVLVRSAEVIQASLGDDKLALMRTQGAHYYGLEEPGSRIWQLLETERALGSICDILVDEFEVPRQHCLRDTSHFIQSLISEGLVTVVDD